MNNELFSIGCVLKPFAKIVQYGLSHAQVIYYCSYNFSTI